MRRRKPKALKKRSASPGHQNPVEEFRRQMGDPQGWAEGFARLAQAISAADLADTAATLEAEVWSCAECRLMLDMFVNDLLAGYDVAQEYPQIARHLQSCPACREAVAQMIETLRTDEAPSQPDLPPSGRPHLSFLQPEPANASWTERLRSRISGAPFGVTFAFQADFLRRLFWSPSPLPTRHATPGGSASAPHLLLTQTTMLDTTLAAVEVIALANAQERDQLTIQINVIPTTDPLPQDVWATLTWGGEARSARVPPDGQVTFDNVSAAALRAVEPHTDRFEVTFEVLPTEDDTPRATG